MQKRTQRPPKSRPHWEASSEVPKASLVTERLCQERGALGFCRLPIPGAGEGTAQVEAGQPSRKTARGADVGLGFRPHDLQVHVKATTL